MLQPLMGTPDGRVGDRLPLTGTSGRTGEVRATVKLSCVTLLQRGNGQR